MLEPYLYKTVQTSLTPEDEGYTTTVEPGNQTDSNDTANNGGSGLAKPCGLVILSPPTGESLKVNSEATFEVIGGIGVTRVRVKVINEANQTLLDVYAQPGQRVKFTPDEPGNIQVKAVSEYDNGGSGSQGVLTLTIAEAAPGETSTEKRQVTPPAYVDGVSGYIKNNSITISFLAVVIIAIALIILRKN